MYGSYQSNNKSLGVRGRAGLIIGNCDEMKDYRVYIPKDKVVIVTQHVRNVETLTEEQNEQFRRVHLAELKSSSDNTESSKTGAVLKLR